MPTVPCLGCGQLTTTPNKGRCPDCYSEVRQRYGKGHQRQRAAWAPTVALGLVPCSRCGQPIEQGQAWDLDHRPWGTEPAHASCNRGAAGEA